MRKFFLKWFVFAFLIVTALDWDIYGCLIISRSGEANARTAAALNLSLGWVLAAIVAAFVTSIEDDRRRYVGW